MSKSVESRVVEMRFDNKQFESGVKQSLSTLEKLKMALKNITSSNKGLDTLGAAAKTSKSSLDQIAASVSALEKRFSFLGETVRAVANKMRDSVVNTIGGAVNYVKEGIVQGGIKRAMNIENAHYQLQALLKDEEQVQKVMDNAMESVDGTAYGFDEAAKAAAMFKASGIETGEAMTNALKGIAGTAAMTNAEYERISLIFTSVAGQGRLMGDQLLQLSSLGLNAPASIATFFNETNEGVSKASDSVAAAVKKISKGAKVTESDIREMVTEGKISFQIFAEAMYSAFGESAERANETFNGSLSNMRAALARIGAEFVSPLIEQNSAVVLLINKVKDQINVVKKALTFDKEAGNVEAYSKRFTDAVLGMAESLGTWVENLDVASGMKVFYNVVDSLINIFKALWSVIKPIGKAFADVFLSFNVGDVINVTGALKSLTEGLILSEKSSKHLQDAFEGVFSIIKLLVDGVVGLVSAIFNVSPPVGLLSDGLLGLVGSIGKGLTAFAECVRESTLVKLAFEGVSIVAKVVGNAITGLATVVKNFINKAIEMRVLETIVGGVVEGFRMLGEFAAPYIELAASKLEEFYNVAKKFIGSSVSAIGEKISGVWKALTNLKTSDLTKYIARFKEVFVGLMDAFGGGFKGVLENLKTFGERIKAAFDFTKIVDIITNFRETVQSFADWFNDIFGKIFNSRTLGSSMASAGGLAIIYAIVKISKSFTEATTAMTKVAESLPKLLGSVSNALGAWAKKTQAEAVKQIAEAILILAAALAVLSFTDTDKAIQASVALSIVATALMFGISKLNSAAASGRNIADRLTVLANGLRGAMKQISKAIKMQAIASAFKSFGAAVLMIAGSLIAIALMYKNNQNEMDKAAEVVGIIVSAMIAIVGLMVIAEKKLTISGGTAMKMAIAVFAVASALKTIVNTLKAVFKLELPSDWGKKLAIFELLLASLAGVTIALGLASKIAGGNNIKSGPIVAVALALKLSIGALKEVFKMDIDSDWGVRIGILTILFADLAGLIVAVGAASKLAGGNVKAAGTLLALALDIAVITGALMILSIIPAEGMLKGAVSLGLVMLALAGDLLAVSKITTPDANKAVLSMAVMVGAITAALGLLTLVPIKELAVSATALGVVLLALATDFLAVSKIANADIWQPIAAMIAAVIAIAGSLAILANQPWQGMLAAATAMSATLLAFSAAFLIISKAQNMDLAKAATFLAFTLAVIPIGTALYALSNQPWQGMLSASASISVVLLAFTAAFAIISKSNPNITAVVGFVAASVALIPIAAALKMLAGQDWNSIMPGAASLAIVAASLGAAMALMSKTNVTGVVGFVAAAVALIPIANVIKTLSGLSWEEVAKGLVALAGGLAVIGVAGLAGTAVAPGLLALSVSLLAFAAAIAAVGVALPVFINGLEIAVAAISNFVEGVSSAVPEMFKAGLDLMSGLVQGIVSGISGVIETAKSVASGVVNTVKDFLGIHSPSTVFEALGINVDEGFAQGLLGGEGNVSGALENVFGGLSDKINLESMFGKGEEGASLFGDGLLSGEGGVNDIMNQIADSSDIDLSSFTTTGEEGAGNLAEGLLNGDANVESALQDLLNTDSMDIGSFLNLGTNATDEYGKGLKNGEGSVKSTVEQITNPSKTDVKSYTTLGKKAADNFANGVKTGAKSASSGAASSVAKTLQTAIQSAVKNTNFKTIGKEISETISKGITADKEKVKSAIDSVMKTASSAIKQTNSQFKTLGSQTAAAYANGVKSKSSTISDTMKSVITKLTKEIKSNNKDFKSKGEDLAENLIKGFKSKDSDATKTAKNTASKIVKELKSAAKNFQTPGKDSATQYTKALKSALESSLKTLSSTMMTHGKQLVQGFAKGINANMGVAKTAASNLAKSIDQQIKSDLQIHSPSKVAEERGKQVVEGFAQGISKNVSKVKDAVSGMTKEVTDGLTKSLNDMKSAANKVLKDNYLSELIASKIRVKDLPFDEMMKGLSGVTGRLSTAMMGTKTLDISDIAEDLEVVASGFVRQNVGYQQLISSEEDYWARLLAIKQNGFDREKYLEMDINTFRKTMLAEYQAIMDDYHAQIEQEQQNIFNQVNMFESVDKSLMRTRQEQADADYKLAKKEEAAAKAREKSGEKEKETTEIKREIVKSMGDIMGENNKLLKSYEKNLKAAQKRLEGTNLWEYLLDQGVDALPKLKELNQMSDKELKEAIKNFDDGMNTAYNIAVIKMGAVTDETEKNINEMFEITGDGLANSETQKEMGLTLEEQYWTKLLAIKQNGANQEKYIEMDLKTFRENVLAEANQILQDYQQQFESTRDNIMAEFGLFDEVSEKTAKTSEELMTNLQAQIQAYDEYNQTMLSLVERLQGTNLLTEIQKLGVGSLDQLRVINGMTDDELTQYANLYDEKLEMAGEIANNKLEEIKEETGEKLKDLFGGIEEINVDEFTEKFDGTLESLESFLLNMGEKMTEHTTEIVADVNEMTTSMGEALETGIAETQAKAETESAKIGESIAKGIESASNDAATAAEGVANSAATAIQEQSYGFQEAGQTVGNNYVNGINSTQNEAKNSGESLATNTIGGIDSKAQTFTTEGVKESTNYTNGIKQNYGSATSAGQGLANSALDGLRSAFSEFYSIGVEMGGQAASGLSSARSSLYSAGANVVQGYIDGINSMMDQAKSAASQLGSLTEDSTKESLDIHSPSRVMMNIGEFAGEGYINGLLACVAKAAAASEELGTASAAGASEYLSGISDVIDEDSIRNPIIKPEVDLSDVVSSVRSIQQMFSDAIKITASDVELIGKQIKVANKSGGKATVAAGGAETTKGNGGGNTFEFVQNNYSPKPLSRSELYRQTNNQFSLFKATVGSI